jgi:hypothetical protein
MSIVKKLTNCRKTCHHSILNLAYDFPTLPARLIDFAHSDIQDLERRKAALEFLAELMIEIRAYVGSVMRATPISSVLHGSGVDSLIGEIFRSITNMVDGVRQEIQAVIAREFIECTN